MVFSLLQLNNRLWAALAFQALGSLNQVIIFLSIDACNFLLGKSSGLLLLFLNHLFVATAGSAFGTMPTMGGGLSSFGQQYVSNSC